MLCGDGCLGAQISAVESKRSTLTRTQRRDVRNCVRKKVETCVHQGVSMAGQTKWHKTDLKFLSTFQPLLRLRTGGNLLYVFVLSGDPRLLHTYLLSTINNKNGVDTFADKNSPSMILYSPCEKARLHRKQNPYN